MKAKKWYDYLWIAELLYLALGLTNILFAWLGMLFFSIPLLIALFGGGKAYCNRYCGRGQLIGILGNKLKDKVEVFNIGSTYKVFTGAPLQQTVTLLWVFKLPWQWAEVSMVTPWFAQFAFGFFGIMLTSTILELITMVLFRPKSWCVYCPMGTMTQGICKLKHGKELKTYGRTSQNDCGTSETSGQ